MLLTWHAQRIYKFCYPGFYYRVPGRIARNKRHSSQIFFWFQTATANPLTTQTYFRKSEKLTLLPMGGTEIGGISGLSQH